MPFDLHKDVYDQLARMETKRQHLLATSPYASRVEHILNRLCGENEIYLNIDPLSLWASVYNCESWSQSTPILRELRREGWVIKPTDEGKHFEKLDYAFRWILEYEVREGLTIDLTLNLRVKSAEEHDGITCQRIKVGERREEKVVDIYEIVCPS